MSHIKSVLFGTAYPKSIPTFQRLLRSIIGIATGLIFLSALFIANIPGLHITFPFVFPKAIIFQSLVEIMTVCWIALMILDKRVRPNLHSPITIGAGIFLTTLLATQAFSVDPFISFWSTQNNMMGLFQYIHFILWFLILTSVFREREQWQQLFLYSTYVSVAVSVFGFCEWFKVDFNRIGSTFGNSLILSSYLLIQIFIVFLLLILEKQKRKQLLWILGLQFFTLFLTGSRSAFVALGVAGILAVVLFRTSITSKVEKKFRLQKKYFLPAFLACCLLCITSIVFLERSHISENALLRTNTSDRIILWNIALQASKEKPVSGWGLGQYGVAFNKLFDPIKTNQILYEMWYDQAHNQYLDQLVSNGIIGLLGYLVLWSSVIWFILRGYKVKSTEEKSIANILILFVTAILIEKLFLFDIFSEQVTLFFFLAALPTLLTKSTSEPQLPTAKKQVTLAAICFAPLIIGIIPLIWITDIHPFVDELQVKHAEDALTQSNVAETLLQFTRATNHSSLYQSDLILHMSEPLLIAKWTFGIDSPEMQQLLSTVQTVTASYIQNHPFDTKLVFSQAWMNGTTIRDTASQTVAQRAAEQAQQLAPMRAEPLEMLAIVAQHQNRFEDAHALIQKALQQTSVQGYAGELTFNNAAIFAAEGNYPEAFLELERAYKLGAPTYGRVSFLDGLVQGSEKKTPWPTDMNAYLVHMIKKYQTLPNILEDGVILYHNGGYTRQENILLEELNKVDSKRADALKARLIK